MNGNTTNENEINIQKKIIDRRGGPVCPPNPYPPIDDPLIMDSFQQNEMNTKKKDDNRTKK